MKPASPLSSGTTLADFFASAAISESSRVSVEVAGGCESHHRLGLHDGRHSQDHHQEQQRRRHHGEEQDAASQANGLGGLSSSFSNFSAGLVGLGESTFGGVDPQGGGNAQSLSELKHEGPLDVAGALSGFGFQHSLHHHLPQLAGESDVASGLDSGGGGVGGHSIGLQEPQAKRRRPEGLLAGFEPLGDPSHRAFDSLANGSAGGSHGSSTAQRYAQAPQLLQVESLHGEVGQHSGYHIPRGTEGSHYASFGGVGGSSSYEGGSDLHGLHHGNGDGFSTLEELRATFMDAGRTPQRDSPTLTRQHQQLDSSGTSVGSGASRHSAGGNGGDLLTPLHALSHSTDGGLDGFGLDCDVDQQHHHHRAVGKVLDHRNLSPHLAGHHADHRLSNRDVLGVLTGGSEKSLGSPMSDGTSPFGSLPGSHGGDGLTESLSDFFDPFRQSNGHGSFLGEVSGLSGIDGHGVDSSAALLHMLSSSGLGAEGVAAAAAAAGASHESGSLLQGLDGSNSLHDALQQQLNHSGFSGSAMMGQHEAAGGNSFRNGVGGMMAGMQQQGNGSSPPGMSPDSAVQQLVHLHSAARMGGVVPQMKGAPQRRSRARRRGGKDGVQFLQKVDNFVSDEGFEGEDGVFYKRPDVDDATLSELCDISELHKSERFSKLIVDFHDGIHFPLGEGGRELLRACLNAKGCKGRQLQGASVQDLLQLARDWGLWNIAVRIRVERATGELCPDHEAFVKFKAMQSQLRKYLKREQMLTERDDTGRITDIHFEEMKYLTLGKDGREKLRAQLRRMHDKDSQRMDELLERNNFKYSELRNATVQQLLKMAHICGIWEEVIDACRKQEQKKDEKTTRRDYPGPAPSMGKADCLSGHMAQLGLAGPQMTKAGDCLSGHMSQLGIGGGLMDGGGRSGDVAQLDHLVAAGDLSFGGTF